MHFFCITLRPDIVIIICKHRKIFMIKSYISYIVHISKHNQSQKNKINKNIKKTDTHIY